MPTRTGLGLGLLVALAACGSSRTGYATYPGAPAAFDRAQSNTQAVEIADKVIAAAGGAANWAKAKQIRWSEAKLERGAVTTQGEQAWDRWNGRHYGRVDVADGGAIVAYDVYGDFVTSYLEAKSGTKQMIEGREKGAAVTVLKTAYQLDVTVMFMPFLMQEPGTRLDYIGVVKDGDVEYHDIKVTFGTGDAARKDLVYHAIVDKTTYVLRRVDVEKPSTSEKLGFELSDWTEAGGLKFPATRKNLGSGEVAQTKNIKVGDPDDTLYMRPLT